MSLKQHICFRTRMLQGQKRGAVQQLETFSYLFTTYSYWVCYISAGLSNFSLAEGPHAQGLPAMDSHHHWAISPMPPPAFPCCAFPAMWASLTLSTSLSPLHSPAA